MCREDATPPNKNWDFFYFHKIPKSVIMATLLVFTNVKPIINISILPSNSRLPTYITYVLQYYISNYSEIHKNHAFIDDVKTDC